MDKSATHLQAQVIHAVFESATPLNHIGLLLGVINALVIANTHDLLLLLALSNILAGMVQHYFHWRVALDRKLLPLLLQHACSDFDIALATVFRRVDARLKNRNLDERLSGARRLFRRQCYCLSVQLMGTLVTLGVFIYARST